MTKTIEQECDGLTDSEVRERIGGLEAELAELRAARRVSKEEGRRRLEALRTDARERLEAAGGRLAEMAALDPRPEPPRGLADVLALAQGDLVDRAVAAVDAAECGPEIGQYTHETDEQREADLEGRRQKIGGCRVELERRDLAREEEDLQARKQGVLARIGGTA